MFSWLFGSNNEENDVIKNIFYYTITNNTNQVIKLLNEHKVDLNDKKCRDICNNTLLHILANGDNMKLTEHLLNYGLRTDHVNLFNEKAIDIALKNKNLTMVKLLSNIVQDHQLIKKINGLESQQKVLYDRIEKSENNLVKAQEEIRTLKRKRCDQCEENTRECKRLKTENDALVKTNQELTKDNGDLQTTITNLRASFKK